MFGGINPEPVVQNYARSQKFLSAHPHDICLVTDGDADRVGGMDGRGHYLTTHQIICLLLHHFVVNRGGAVALREPDGAARRPYRVVKALTTTSMVDKICAHYGLPLTETGVGFKYICGEMLKGNVLLGAVESGGIGFPNHIPERDGHRRRPDKAFRIAGDGENLREQNSGETGETIRPASLRPDRHAFSFGEARSVDGIFANNPPQKLIALAARPDMTKTFDGVKFVAADSSWLMLRGSGHRTDFADLRGGEIGRRRAKTFEVGSVIDEAGVIGTTSAFHPVGFNLSVFNLF